MFRVLIITFLVSIPLILGQRPGSCPDITGIPLNANRMVGLWYQNRRDSSSYDKAVKCDRVYWYPPKGMNYTLRYDGVSTITNAKSSIMVEDSATTRKARHHVPVLGEVDVAFRLLSADYDKWRVVWNCVNHGNTHTETSRVLTRQQFPDEQKLQQFIDQSFRYWNLQKPEFIIIDQNC